MFKSKMKHNVKNKEERKTKKRNKSKSIREKRCTREGAEVLDGYCVVQVTRKTPLLLLIALCLTSFNFP